ncbi:hypothetical protein GCM10020000_24750 [Streptomyces olivoverticillatus]
MRELAPGTDRWGAEVAPDREGLWSYAVEAWSDPVATWRRQAGIKVPAGIDAELVLEEGARLYERAAAGVPKKDGREAVLGAVDALRDAGRPVAARLAAALTPEVTAALAKPPAARTGHLQPDGAGAGRAGAGAVRLVVRAVPALGGRGPGGRAPPGAVRSARPPAGCPRSPRWASTSSTCRRSTPSAAPSARAPTMR